MIMIFNLIHHHFNLHPVHFLLHHTFIGAHQFRLYNPCCTRDIHHCVISHRIIDQWTFLPQGIVNASNTFKQLFDSYNENVFYANNNIILQIL